jgi:hypothetical protein
LLRRTIDPVAFQHRLDQFLDKQRHAVSALNDLVDERLRKRFAAGDVADQRYAFTSAEAIEHHAGDVRLAGPRRLKVGAVGDDQENREHLHALDGEREQFERGGIAPLRILEDHHDRSLAREAFELLD